MIKKIVTGLCILLALLLALTGVVAAYYWRPALAPINPPPAQTFPAQEVARGRMLAGIGNCASCHTDTARDGAEYAGGRGLATAFGTIYATNLTPDTQTGIGRWSPAAFQRAMREGVRRDGAQLYPVFPYAHFTHVNDADLTALYAYFMTRPAVYAVPHANTLPFPLNLRALQAGWKLLYFKPGELATDAARGQDWNRGRYLAEGLAHCATCHTPRNALGAEIASSAYLGRSVEHWYAPPLTSANTAPLPWTADELYAFLRTGTTALHGVASGPMAQVVQGLTGASDSDVHALAVYFAEVAGAAQRKVDVDAVVQEGIAHSQKVSLVDNDRGASLYVAACASCHSNSDGRPVAARPELSLNSAVSLPDPANLLQVILHGSAKPGLMPGFAPALTDADIAQLAAYLRRSRSSQPAWPELEAAVAHARAAAPLN